jgi:hypothetical protein
LYKLFDLIVNRDHKEPERSGKIGKTTLADFKVPGDLRERLESPSWVAQNFRALVQQATLTDIKDTSYTCIAIAKAVDFCDGWGLENSPFSKYKVHHPVVNLAEDIFKRREPYVDKLNDYDPEVNTLEELLELKKEIPIMSLKIITQRTLHRVLSSISRSIKLWLG